MKAITRIFTLSFFVLTPIFVFAAPPIAPQTTNLTDGPSLTLTWQDNSDNELFFAVYIQKPGEENLKFHTLVLRNTTTFTDRQDIPGRYCYRVQALNDTGDSGFSNEACGTLVIASPEIPVFTVTVQPGTVSSPAYHMLKWTPVRNALGIHIERKVTERGAWGKFENVSNTSGIWHDHRIAPATLYCYRMVAYGYGGDSVLSSEVCNQ